MIHPFTCQSAAQQQPQATTTTDATLTDPLRGPLLPLELIPEILYHLAPPIDGSPFSVTATSTVSADSIPSNSSFPSSSLPIASPLQPLLSTALVSRSFYHHTVPLLWYRLFLRSQHRLVRVFRTLSTSQRLCRLVKVLELRVYPLGMPAEELERLEGDIAKALRWMTQLRVCVWTRMGSLNGRVLPDLLGSGMDDRCDDQGKWSKDQLHTLELTGNTGLYDVQALWKGQVREMTSIPSKHTSADLGNINNKVSPVPFPFPALLHLSFLLPDSGAIRATIEIANRRPLQSISLLCQHTNALTSTAVEELALNVSQLQKLVLVGCKALDGEGLRKLLKGSQRGIRILALEGCSVQPSSYPSLQPFLSDSLLSLTLTLPRSALASHHDFYLHLNNLVSKLHSLEEFTLYAPGGIQADEEPAYREDHLLFAGEFESSEEPISVYEDRDGGRNGHSDARRGSEETAQSNERVASPLQDYQPLPTFVPRLPLSLLRSLFTHRIAKTKGNLDTARNGLQLLRLHGIVCSLQALTLIGERGVGLQDLVLQLEDVRTVELLLKSLQPLANTLKKLHILSRPASRVRWRTEELEWFAERLINRSLHQPCHRNVHTETDSSTRDRERHHHHHHNRPGPLVQVGLRNRVWEVERNLIFASRDATGPNDAPPSPLWHRDVVEKDRSVQTIRGNEDHLHRSTSECCNVYCQARLKPWNASEGRWPEALLVIKA